MKIRPEDALEYHSKPPAGKLAVIPTKPCRTQRDLSLAYTPGVAVPCLEIERDPNNGRSLWGRWQALRASDGDVPATLVMRRRWQDAWNDADTRLQLEDF